MGKKKDMTKERPIIEGKLKKKAVKSGKNWKERYFRLLSDRLQYFKSAKDSKPRGEMMITADHYVTDLVNASEETEKFVFVISDFFTTYKLSAESEPLRDYWMRAIANIIRNLQTVEDWYGTAGLNRERTESEIQQDYEARLAAYKKSQGINANEEFSKEEQDLIISEMAVEEARRKEQALLEMEKQQKTKDMLETLERKRREAEERIKKAEEAEKKARERATIIRERHRTLRRKDEVEIKRDKDAAAQKMIEEEKKKVALKKKQEEEQKAREEATRRQREESERKRREEEADRKKKREEAEKGRREEAERRAREEEEEKERKRKLLEKEAADRKRMEEAKAKAEAEAAQALARSSSRGSSIAKRLSNRLMGRPNSIKSSASSNAPTPMETKPPAAPEESSVASVVSSAASSFASGIAARLNDWNKKIEGYQESQASNVFSGKHVEGPKISKRDDNYGKAPAGSKTEERARQAAAWVDKEIDKLISVIEDIGYKNDNGETCVNFGKLFITYQDISDTLVGILMRAKKRKRLRYEGDMLFQGRNDDTIITLIK